MNVNNKIAVIYGAGGSLGGAVARSLAAAGAHVILTGRNYESLRHTSDAIRAANGKAEVEVVDASDQQQVEAHLDKVIHQHGRIDISFNAIGIDVIQDVPLIKLDVGDYVTPVTKTLETNFITATAAARKMKDRSSGVILTITATPGGIGYPGTAGFAAACVALESFTRNLASEIGQWGVRVVNIRSGGSPDSRIFKEAIEQAPEMMATVLTGMKNDTMLNDLPLIRDIANTALFLASDMARMITGVTVDVTGGTTVALNYRKAATNIDS